MESIEQMNERLEMVEMHDFFLNRIEKNINQEKYIEATWLIYSCIENRFFRTLSKFKKKCKFCSGNSKCAKSKNELAISTKMDCIKRLVEENVICISENFSLALIEKLKKWIKKRNDMMHNLLSLEKYDDMDTEFKQLAIDGQILLNKLYKSCTGFRKKFFEKDYEFIFPEKAMEECACNKFK